MKENIQKSLKELADAVEAQDWSDIRVYANFVAQTYYYSRHGTRMLALAGSRFPFSENDVHKRFVRHIGEEMSHEILAERDLKALGFSLADFPELPATKAFYQTQYYLIEHENPWSFFGFIVALEGLAVGKGPWLQEQVTRLYGEKTAGFLMVHAKEDIDHIKEAEATLEKIDPRLLPGVMSNLELSCYLYRKILEECGRAAKLSRRKAA